MASANARKRKKKRRLNKKGKFAVFLLVLLVLFGVWQIVANLHLFEGNFGSLIKGIATPSNIRDKVSTFLVVGIADDPNERESTNLTDTILVVTVDFEAKKASVLQVPRDTYIGDETPTGKINAIVNRDPEYWDYSGLEGLSRMLHEMLQINIDHYVTMQMDGFEEIVDSIGGVTMNVPTDMELNGTYVSAGQQTLNGEQAIAVVRTRNVYDNGDLGRVETQKIFMSAFVEKCLSLGTLQMTSVISQCFEYVNTDLTLNEAIGYYKKVNGMDMSSLSIMSLPGTPGTYASPDGDQSVYELDINATADMLNQYFRPYSDAVPAEQLQIEQLYSDDYSNDDGYDNYDGYDNGDDYNDDYGYDDYTTDDYTTDDYNY